MIYVRLPVLLTVLFLIMAVRISVEGIEGEGGKKGEGRVWFQNELEVVVRGAVEDQSWMTSATEEELRTNLGRYFDGVLLDSLVQRSWDFIARPTDWYSRYHLMEMKVLYEDGKRAVAEALISIEDLDTGHTETGRGLFAMRRTSGGWKIYYFSIMWNNQAGSGKICYNDDALDNHGGY